MMCDASPARQVDRDLWQALSSAMWPIGYVPADCVKAANIVTQQERHIVKHRQPHRAATLMAAVRAVVAR